MKPRYRSMLRKMETREGQVPPPAVAASWSLYILRCGDGSFYTGVTTDIDRRFREHEGGKASRFTRTRRPVVLVYQETCGSRSQALSRECAVKSMGRQRKEELVAGGSAPNRSKRQERRKLRSAPITLIVLAAALAGGLWAAPQDKEKPSYFTELWQLNRATRATKPGITFHRSNYALAFSYNFTPNPAPLQEVDPDEILTKPEVTFQLSFKARLWRDILGKDMVLWFAYTQRSFWQLYNVDDSSPFRETNYEPEVLVNIGTHFSALGLNARFIQLGVNHQSNGQSEPLSRSWNRLVANIGVERGDLSLLLKGWYRIPDAEDDNPGLTHYVGSGELWAYYFLKKHRLGIMVRDNLNFRENRGAIQLEWSFPLFAMIGGYVQYFLGYGESLLDYNHRVNRIGIGFILSDWY